MRRALRGLLLAGLALAVLAPSAPAQDFGVSEIHVAFLGPKGETLTQAGSHPYQMTTSFHFTSVGEEGKEIDEAVKDMLFAQMPGFVGNPTAVPRCTTAEFLVLIPLSSTPQCPDSTAVGVTAVGLAASSGEGSYHGAVYNLAPPPGVAAKLGFWIASFPVTVELGVAETAPYNILGGPTNISQVAEVVSSTFTLWGTPADPSHDPLRGRCLDTGTGESLDSCPANVSEVPFLTLPRACEGPLRTTYAADSWEHPGKRLSNVQADLSDPAWVAGFTETEGMSGCGKLGFGPEIDVQPTSTSAESASGLDLEIDVADEGVNNPDGLAQADIKATEITLPPGLTANPSAAEGLGVCTPAQFQAASLDDPGCPPASKLGSLEVETPILQNHTLKGAVYLAEPDDPSTPEEGAENPFDSLLAAYLTIRDEELGVFVKLPAEIETDPRSGQIITTVRDMPPFPLSRVKVHLRSGPRAPLITPPSCGNYVTEALLYPTSGAEALQTSSSFQLTSGPAGGPCPAGGTLPFAPGFQAGSANSAASFYTPFSMRLTRQDGEQDLTRFSATLPPGAVGKIAGLAKCSDAAIAAAKTRTGAAELASPSCPAAAKIGTVLAGAGVGTALTYVPGSLYLAGPYNGDPLSVAAIVPALAGPFDVGTVVTRVALTLNQSSAQVEVDGAASDPLPHILKGLPLKIRDVRVYADRPQFLLNPTNCEPMQTVAQIFGSGADAFNPADDSQVSRSARFQAASCASLGFAPKLSIKFKGGTRRNDHPALRAKISYPYPSGPGYANIAKAVVTLPHSEFIDPGHLSNPCTRVQFAAHQCPSTSVLGYARATTPLTDEPFEGPVYFRSNGGERKIPDVVADLHGLFNVVLVGFVDSRKGRIRTTFANTPDVPVSSFSLNFNGGKKGVLVNSANLCRHKRHLVVKLVGQNNATHNTNPRLNATGCRSKKRHAARASHRAARR